MLFTAYMHFADPRTAVAAATRPVHTLLAPPRNTTVARLLHSLSDAAIEQHSWDDRRLLHLDVYGRPFRVCEAHTCHANESCIGTLSADIPLLCVPNSDYPTATPATRAHNATWWSRNTSFAEAALARTTRPHLREQTHECKAGIACKLSDLLAAAKGAIYPRRVKGLVPPCCPDLH